MSPTGGSTSKQTTADEALSSIFDDARDDDPLFGDKATTKKTSNKEVKDM